MKNSPRARGYGDALLVSTLMAILIALFSCGEANMGDLSGEPSETELRDSMNLVSSQKIFFGHQSVGLNIIEGIKEVGAGMGTRVPVIERTRDPSAVKGPGIYHEHVGQNRYPLSKLADFDGIMRSGMAKAVDAAFLKFCYVDVYADTDVEALFAAYRGTMDSLKADFPGTRFIHFTVPVTTDEGGLIGFAKGILGRKRRGHDDNDARQRYNDLLIGYYGGKEPIFDIALIESSSASGESLRKSWKGRKYLEMRKEYSTDGGHLGAAGKRRVAGRLITFLAEAVRVQAP